jgi:ribonuclease BN (tRNA processing enzyme)
MQADIGGLSFTFRDMTHPVQSFAAGADLFLADTGLLERDKVPGKSPHLSAEEVGRIAKAAGVKRLVLTHI